MSHTLDIHDRGEAALEPDDPRQFRQLQRGQRLRDREERVWTVQAAPFENEGVARIVIRSGDLVRRVDERWADDYEVVAEDGG